jgi:hypothetical protein
MKKIMRSWKKYLFLQLYCVHMYINGKIRPVETIPGREEGE